MSGERYVTDPEDQAEAWLLDVLDESRSLPEGFRSSENDADKLIEVVGKFIRSLDARYGYVLSAAEGKTSGGHTASQTGPTENVANSKAADSPVPTTPARGPEEAGLSSDALKLAREVLEAEDEPSWSIDIWITAAFALAREVVRLHESTATYRVRPPLQPPTDDAPTASADERRWWIVDGVTGRCFDRLDWAEQYAERYEAPKPIEVVPAARAEAAERARDVHARSAMSYRDKWESAEARVRELEEQIRRREVTLPMYQEQAAHSMRERAAKAAHECACAGVSDEWSACARAIAKDIRALPLREEP